MKITAVIVAGGKGTRMGADKNKVFLKILGLVLSEVADVSDIESILNDTVDALV